MKHISKVCGHRTLSKQLLFVEMYQKHQLHSSKNTPLLGVLMMMAESVRWSQNHPYDDSNHFQTIKQFSDPK